MLILIAVGVLFGLQATGAAATERTRTKPPTTTSSFGLRASGRYWVEVTATSNGWRKAPTVTVEAVGERYKVEQVTVAYSTRGRWLDNDGGFTAKLPGMGRIAVRLDETSAHLIGRPGGCKGRETVLRKGTFHGTISFRGQRGFVTVHGSSAPGQIRETFRLTCRETVYEPAIEEVAPGTYTPTVRATGSSGGGTASFSVAGPPETEPPTTSGGIPTLLFGATYRTRWHGFDVLATTSVATGSYRYHVPGWPATHTDAIAEPPRPFTGKGIFHLESPTASSWSGELGIDFPGIGHVALSGPSFTAELCEYLTCVGSPQPVTSTAASARPDPAAARVALDRGADPIYFWANLGNPVKTPVKGLPNPPVVKPSTLVIFEDGSWVIEKLHWTGWGSAVAKATGKSNADTDEPNVAEGKRIITPAKVILYNPGTFGGHRVYRCIRIKLKKPAHYAPNCLRRSGNSVILGPPGTGAPVGKKPAAGGARHVDEFFSPGRKIWCQISPSAGEASCGTYPAPPTHAAFLAKNGDVEICAVEKLEYPGGAGHPPAGCFQNWPNEKLPILRVGEATSAGGVRCTSGADGITCLEVGGPAKGKGFRIDAQEAVELPGALELAATRPACAKRALTQGLRNGGLRGYVDSETFGCAGNFAYAGVIVDDNEVTVLFRAAGGHWHPVSRARFCENGSVPKQIYRPACKTN